MMIEKEVNGFIITKKKKKKEKVSPFYPFWNFLPQIAFHEFELNIDKIQKLIYTSIIYQIWIVLPP